MPDIPTAVTAVKFQKNNIIENYFGQFGDSFECKSETAGRVFSNYKIVGQELTNWYNEKLKNITVTTAIKFSFNIGFGGYKKGEEWRYKIISKDYIILKIKNYVKIFKY